MTRKTPRLFLLTATLSAFFAQSTGAANFGPMAMPGAARLAFQAVSPAALKLPPPAKAVAVAPAYVAPLVEPPPYRAHVEDALGEMLLEGAVALKARWEAFKTLVGPDELPLKAVDLDEPTVPVAHPEFKLPLPAPAPIAVPRVHEAKSVSAPAPRPADRAQKRAAEIMRLQRKAVEEAQPRYHISQIKRMPSLQRRAWSTSVGSMRGFGPLNMREATSVPRMDGRWLQGDGVRYRLNFLDSQGVSRFDANGVTYKLAGGVRMNPEEVIPSSYWGIYPVYSHGQSVRFEVEIENTSERDIRNLVVVTRQETFNPTGGQGELLPKTQTRMVVDELKAGQRVTLRAVFHTMSEWERHGSLEQTHARVVAEDRVLADHAQAGIIDPPGDL